MIYMGAGEGDSISHIGFRAVFGGRDSGKRPPLR